MIECRFVCGRGLYNADWALKVAALKTASIEKNLALDKFGVEDSGVESSIFNARSRPGVEYGDIHCQHKLRR